VALATRASNMNPDPKGAPIHMIKMTPIYFMRDLLFYFTTIVYLLVILLFVGQFTISTAAGLLIIYIVYVILVVVQSKR
jgi:Ca2+/Na+ antiporter